MKTHAFFVCTLLAAASQAETPEQERPVVPGQLAEMIDQSDRIVVTDNPMAGAKKLFESTEKADFDALSQALVVTKPDEWLHCQCVGTPAIFLYKEGALLAEITNHHGQLVRCSLWSSDAPIADVDHWISCFDDRGIAGPREEVEKQRVIREQGRRDWDKWIAAIPEGLSPTWQDSLDRFGRADLKPILRVLKTSIPKPRDQILALLHWYGSGEGPWSGYPSYESTVEDLLLEYTTHEIVSAIDIKALTTEQIEGAARLLGGWRFSQKRPRGLEQVPAEIKLALWEHVKGTKDQDKLGRAQYAFEPTE